MTGWGESCGSLDSPQVTETPTGLNSGAFKFLLAFP